MNEAWFVLLPCLLISLPTAWIAARMTLYLVRVEGPSMLPGLDDGDLVLVLRRWPKRWLRRDLIVIALTALDPHGASQPPSGRSRLLIKRVKGLPGDTAITHISELPEFLRASQRAAHDSQGYRIWHIPPEHCFLRGDSPGYDSVIAGPIPFHALRGIVLMKLRQKRALSPVRSTQPHPPSRPQSIDNR